MTKKKIEFTPEEANALVQLLDISIKANGYQVSEAAGFLIKKIVAAFPQEKKKEEEKKK